MFVIEEIFQLALTLGCQLLGSHEKQVTTLPMRMTKWTTRWSVSKNRLISDCVWRPKTATKDTSDEITTEYDPPPYSQSLCTIHIWQPETVWLAFILCSISTARSYLVTIDSMSRLQVCLQLLCIMYVRSSRISLPTCTNFWFCSDLDWVIRVYEK